MLQRLELYCTRTTHIIDTIATLICLFIEEKRNKEQRECVCVCVLFFYFYFFEGVRHREVNHMDIKYFMSSTQHGNEISSVVGKEKNWIGMG